jgi:hypothetical protein
MKIVLIPFTAVILFIQGCSSTNGTLNAPAIAIETRNLENCINGKNDVKIFLTVSNSSDEDLLIRAINVFLDCNVMNEDGDTLKADYRIAHGRDWSDEPYYLVKAHDSINIPVYVQKLFYYKLVPGERYKCELSYYNDLKNFRNSKKEFGKIKMFRGEVLLKPFYFETCKN